MGAQVYQNITSINNGIAEHNIQLNESKGMYLVKVIVNGLEYNSTVIIH